MDRETFHDLRAAAAYVAEMDKRAADMRALADYRIVLAARRGASVDMIAMASERTEAEIAETLERLGTLTDEELDARVDPILASFLQDPRRST